jgi:hypothetical protein
LFRVWLDSAALDSNHNLLDECIVCKREEEVRLAWLFQMVNHSTAER